MLWFLPPLVWTGLIAYLGSGGMGSDETSGWFIPFLSALLPGVSREVLATLHFLIRKAAHVFEYGVLAILWRRAVGASWSALALCVLTASLDEIRQSFLPSRMGSVWDVLLDGAGAAAALLAASALRVLPWKAVP